MKKLLIVLVFISINLVGYAEKKVSEYYSDYFEKTYDIEATTIKDGNFTFYIYCNSFDSHEEIGFSLKSKDVPLFVIALTGIKDKFSQWAETAKENGVVSYNKDFEIEFPTVDSFFRYGSKWHFDFRIKMQPFFLVTKDGECLVVFRSGELTASDNRYMNVEGFALVFTSEKEIDDFIKAIDVQTVIEETSREQNVDALFE